MSVFAEDVVFVETPFSSSLKGLEEVRRFWADTPYHQSEVTFTSGEIYSAGPWFSTEFKCRFPAQPHRRMGRSPRSHFL